MLDARTQWGLMEGLEMSWGKVVNVKHGGSLLVKEENEW